MSRRRSAKKRVVKPDIKYSDQYVTRLINCVMRKGKIETARGIVYSAFDKIEQETKRNPLEVFKEALDRVRPETQVRSRRIGGATHLIPSPIHAEKSESLGLRWIVKSVRKRISRNAHDSLAKALMDGANGVGDAMEERKKMHAMAEANKAFMHVRW